MQLGTVQVLVQVSMQQITQRNYNIKSLTA